MTLIEQAQEATFIKLFDGLMLRVESSDLDDGMINLVDENTHQDYQLGEEDLQGATFYKLAEFGALVLYFIKATAPDGVNNLDLLVWAADAEQAEALWRSHYHDDLNHTSAPESVKQVPVLPAAGAINWELLT